MSHFEPAFKLAGSNPYKGCTVAVVWVHVGLKLKNKSAEPLIQMPDLAICILIRLRWRCQGAEIIEKYIEAKIIQGRAEEYRRCIPFFKGLLVHLRKHILNQHDLLSQLLFFQFGKRASGEAFFQRQHFSLSFLRSEEHTSELKSRGHLVCRLLL